MLIVVWLQALPSHVDAETAAAEAWWDAPEYMIKELSVNSTIGVPGHDERVRMDRDRPYTLRGYAYSGGGRRITRVELSFDGGAHPDCVRQRRTDRNVYAPQIRGGGVCTPHCTRPRAGGAVHGHRHTCMKLLLASLV